VCDSSPGQKLDQSTLVNDADG